MKQHAILVVTSLLALLLLTLHITDDIVRGISKAEPSNTALIVLAVFLYGTLVLAERRSGHVIMLLVGLFAAGMPVIHMRGAHYSEIARSPGGFFFVWTLWALGGRRGFTFILSARGRGTCPRVWVESWACAPSFSLVAAGYRRFMKGGRRDRFDVSPCSSVSRVPPQTGQETRTRHRRR